MRKNRNVVSFTAVDADKANVEAWFTYHPPTGDQPARYVAIRNAAKRFARLLIKHVPKSPDRTVALRKLRESVQMANAAIALDGKVIK